MAAPQFSLPKYWEDWCAWLLGFWLCISPWLLGFDLEPTATRTAVITGILIVFVERITITLHRRWDEWINVILGAWLVICSWMLDISYPAAKTNFVAVGLLVLVLALYEIWEVRRESGNQS
jgi:uncharacterized membrane protein YfcA